MTKLLAQHGPHLGFVVIGVIAFLWTAYRPERGSGDQVRGAVPPATVPPAPGAPSPATVRRSVARRGLFALGPLLGAVATGAILYGVDLGGASVPGAVIWVHSGISGLALLLVTLKVADLGVARIRRAFTRQRLPELISIVLGALSIPLLVTGVGLLLAPSTQSFVAYAHLIVSAWWTGLMLWHLRRYLGPSWRAVRSGQSAAASTSNGVHQPRPAGEPSRTAATSCSPATAAIRPSRYAQD